MNSGSFKNVSNYNIMAEGFRFMPLGLVRLRTFWLSATLTQVFTRARRADVSLRDVTIAQMGNVASKCEWRHAPEVHVGFCDFEKVSRVETCLERRRLTIAYSRRPWAGVARDGGGGRWKSQNRKNVYLSPYVEEPLNSKVIKSFKPELRSCKCFSCFEILMFYVIYIYIYIYEHYMSISHIAVSCYRTYKCV